MALRAEGRARARQRGGQRGRVVGEGGDRARRRAEDPLVARLEGPPRGRVGAGEPAARERRFVERGRLRPEAGAEQADTGGVDVVIGEQRRHLPQPGAAIRQQQRVEGRCAQRVERGQPVQPAAGGGVVLAGQHRAFVLQRLGALVVLGEAAHHAGRVGRIRGVGADPNQGESGERRGGRGGLIRHRRSVARIGREQRDTPVALRRRVGEDPPDLRARGVAEKIDTLARRRAVGGEGNHRHAPGAGVRGDGLHPLGEERTQDEIDTVFEQRERGLLRHRRAARRIARQQGEALVGDVEERELRRAQQGLSLRRVAAGERQQEPDPGAGRHLLFSRRRAVLAGCRLVRSGRRRRRGFETAASP